ncbi:uncharacterized protein VICG_01558 [Vittaforma corneae ATCC 50505]|uniref:Helicase domain-containing protein n=1 Tax=Vittaforma corneae (strain ATCC 50505) TaxID=993615 RepID=L2GKP2_VITCO|nr:uncharacterized protein VICG_01558 [Vittaforma corneae ATCC 50505]ELA41453.1 hypothetical protein VICG_01558 [Vittaforma corneae ATCC 50505]
MTKFSAEHLINVFKNQVKANHRAMFVIVGEDPKQQIHILHGKLNQISNLSNVIWCYKNKNSETPLDKETKKLKNCENDKELEKWVKTYSPEYISYKENGKILGKTCDILILQDFEALTPNMMACSIETVRGGGAIVLLLDLEKSIKEIDTWKSELITQSVNEKLISRFNKRLFKSLVHLPCAMFLDSNLRVIDITSDNIENNKVLMEKEIQTTSDKCINYNSTLFRMCKTKDQISVLTSLVSHLDIDEPSVSSVIAERGRGKSAALGLAIVCAIEKNFPLILISSLFLDNVQAIFEFIIAGLDALEYKKMKDYKIRYTFESKKRLINKIEVVKDYRRTVEFVQSFEEPKAYPNLLVIDEAASIPLLYLKKLLRCKASIHGINSQWLRRDWQDFPNKANRIH